MAYKPPESKREGCHYPNCSGYIEVPFCCHDPEALPAKKARLAQIETPKREWVGLTEDEIIGHTCECVDDGTFNMDCAIDFANSMQEALKRYNT